MTRIFTAAAVSLVAFAGAASAMTVPGGGNFAELKGYAGNADVSVLSDADVQSILRTIHGGGTEAEKQAYVRSILLRAGS